MSQAFAIVFPGQGSQSVTMMDALAGQYPLVQELYEQASDLLSIDLWKLVTEGPEEDLNRTWNTQPAMLVAGVASWKIWKQQQGADPVVMAGHSLGEYTALVCSAAMDFADAVELVAQRGRFMQQAVADGEGAMAAILGLDDDMVREICSSSQQGSVVEAVNFNSPGQVVIAGHEEAVQRAMLAAREAGARRALPLPVSAPSHCALMKPAAQKLADKLAAIELRMPEIPVLHNVSVIRAESTNDLRRLLAEQLFSPVRWVESIQAMQRMGVEKVIELGPGKVLAGLCRRIDKQISAVAVVDDSSLQKALGETA
ncbi:MAG: ACP S-malonyltransferase [gamma proteobacterium symbiont of Bathyaustriella thionipta]|nr:ACP S-malonyltransferase [gamma proteobacterium symbiont of Bathyaustriella thionipta]